MNLLIVVVVWVALGTGDLEAKHTSSLKFFFLGEVGSSDENDKIFVVEVLKTIKNG